MGQANRRGTAEQRTAWAQAARAKQEKELMEAVEKVPQERLGELIMVMAKTAKWTPRQIAEFGKEGT